MSKSPRHSLEDLLALKWMFGALMGLVCITTLLNVSAHGKIPALVASLLIVVALARPVWVYKIPQIVWKGYAVAIIPLVLVDVMSKDTIPALLDLNTWLILFRCLNHNKRREEMQLALLCLFLIIMTGILTASMVFGLQLLVFAAITVGYLMLNSSIETKAEGDYKRVEAMALATPPDIAGALRRGFSMRFLFLGISVFAAMVLVSSVVFIAIPRVNIDDKVNLFTMKSMQSSSGFSDRVRLGEVTNIKKDKTVALRVDVPDDAKIPIEPYWRMLALDEYDAGTFKLSKTLSELQNSPLASPFHAVRYWPKRRIDESVGEDSANAWTFFLEPQVSRYLPLPGSFKHITVNELSEIAIGPHMHSVALKQINSKMVSYQLEGIDFSGVVPDVPANSYPKFLAEALSDPRGGLRYPETLLGLPEEEAAVALFTRFAIEAKGEGQPDAIEFARRVTQLLWRDRGYSMDLKLPENDAMEDPVASWLQAELPGHCEFFASAFTLTARAAGYPARVVVGFKGGEWNSYENYFMVSNADAHAWAEIYDGQGHWIRVDPTPGSFAPSVEQSTIPVSQRVGQGDSVAFLDSLRLLWYRRIVNFDQTAQKEAVVHLKDFMLAYAAVAKGWAVAIIDYIVYWVTSPWSVWRFIYMLTLLAIAIAAFLIQRNMALNLRELLIAPFRRGDPIRRKASKFLAKLADRRPDGSNPAFETVWQDLQRLRFGARSTWPNPRLVFKKARQVR